MILHRLDHGVVGLPFARWSRHRHAEAATLERFHLGPPGVGTTLTVIRIIPSEDVP